MRTTLGLTLGVAAICIGLASTLRSAPHRPSSATMRVAPYPLAHIETQPTAPVDEFVASVVALRDECGTNYQRYLWRVFHLCDSTFRQGQSWGFVSAALQRQGLSEVGYHDGCVGDDTWTVRTWKVPTGAVSLS